MKNHIVALGRIVGVLILVVGVALTFWDMTDLEALGRGTTGALLS